MRFVTRRSMTAVLGLLVVGGAVAILRPAAAEEILVPDGGAVRVAPREWTKATPDDTAGLVVGLKRGADAGKPIERLERTTDVDVVEQEILKGLDAVAVDVAPEDQAAAMTVLRRDPAVEYVEVNHVRQAMDVAVNDPDFAYEWAPRTLRLPEAWESTSGSSDVTVAVLDTGVTAGSDLTGALIPGYDFQNKDSNPADDVGHGTLVAELIAAGGNNGIGSTGVCWTCKIMPVKVLGPGGGSDTTVAAGIKWAADRGADIINMSLGGAQTSTVLADAVAYAQAKGTLVIAAAGNDGDQAWQYPAAYDGVIAVAASDAKDDREWYSSYGYWVDVAAPGWVTDVELPDGTVEPIEGTSFSAPRVAGIAALGLSRSPRSTSDQLAAALTGTAVPVGNYVAHGRVDAAAALGSLPETVASTLSTRVSSPSATTPVKGGVRISVVADSKIRSIAGAPGFESIAADTAAPFDVTYPSGTYTGKRAVTLLATDVNGATKTFDVPLTVDNVKPKITGAAPKQSAKVRGTITVTATGVFDANSGISHVSLFADGRYVGNDKSAPYAVRYNTGTLNKTVKLQWRVYDKAGNLAIFDRTVYADNVAPTVSITKGPKNGAKVKGTVKLAVAASDKYGVARVELLVNGKKVATDSAAAYTFSVKTSTYGKKIKVQVRAYDHAGNVRYVPARTWKR
jgi:thermitase